MRYVICSITWSGFDSPPDQKSFQIASILLRNSPVSIRPSCFAAS